MIYSDTTNKDGLIQDCEFWTNLGDGIISGDTSLLLPRFTGLINYAYDEVLPILFGNDATWQWDDFNHPDRPIGVTDIINGQGDYLFITDGDGNSVLSISEAYIKGPDGIYNRIPAVDPQSDIGVDQIFAQNATNIGTPVRYDKYDTTLTLDPVPNYDMTDGLKVVFSRAPSYFSADDSTKSPGIPVPGQRLLSLIASRDWLAVNKPESETLAVVLKRIAEQKLDLKSHMSKRDKDGRRRFQGARARSV